MKTFDARRAKMLPVDSTEEEITAFFGPSDAQIAARRRLASALEQHVAEMYSPEMVGHVNKFVRSVIHIMPMTEQRATDAGQSLAAIVSGIKMPARAPSKEWLAFSESFVMMRHLASMENAAHDPMLYTRYRTAGPLDWFKSAGKSVVTSEWFEYTTGFAKRCNGRSRSYVSQSYLDMKKKLQRINEMSVSDSPTKFELVAEFTANMDDETYARNLDAYARNFSPRDTLGFPETNLAVLRSEFKARRKVLRARLEAMEKFLRDWNETGRPPTNPNDEITLSELAQNDASWFGGNVLRLTEYIDTLYAEKNSQIPSVNKSDTGARKFGAVALYLVGGAAFAGAMGSIHQQSFHAQVYEASKDLSQLNKMASEYTEFGKQLTGAMAEARVQLADANLSYPEFYLIMREYGVTDIESYNKHIDNIMLGINTDAVTITDGAEEEAKDVETILDTEKRLRLPYADENEVYAVRSGAIIENIAVAVRQPEPRDLIPLLDVDTIMRFSLIAKTDPRIRMVNYEFEKGLKDMNTAIFENIQMRQNMTQEKIENMRRGKIFKDSISTSRGHAILMAEILKKHSPTLFVLDSAAKYVLGPEKINMVDLFFRSSQFENATLGDGDPREMSASPTIVNMFGWAGWASNKMRAAAMTPGRWFMEEAESEFHENISANRSMFDDVASSALFLLNLRQIGITGYTSLGLTVFNHMLVSTVTDVRIAIFWALILFGGGRAAKSVLASIRKTPGVIVDVRDLSLVSSVVNFVSPSAADAIETIWQGALVLLSPLSFGVMLGMRVCDTYNVLVNTWPAIQIAMTTASVVMPVTAVAGASIAAFVFGLRYYQRIAKTQRMPQLDGIVSGVARVIKQRPELTLYGIQMLCMMVQFGYTSIADKSIDDVLKMIYEGKGAILDPVFSAKNSVMAMLFVMGMAATHGFVDMRAQLHRIFGNEVSPYLTVTSNAGADAVQMRYLQNFLGMVIQYFHGQPASPDYVVNKILNN